MPYKHIFGPVPSRRLGISLGVDLVTHKTCSMDCIYCECGKTTCLTLDRKAYVRFEDVTAELDHYFQNNPDPDYITFSGSGEPTLNINLERVMDIIRQQKPGIRVAVLTNSSLMADPDVQKALLKADMVMPSLDAVTPKAFKGINRPLPGLSPERIVAGLESFAKKFQGRLWLEVLILPGINDRVSDLDALKAAIDRIQPEQVQINTLDRPGTLSHIRPASRDELERVKAHLGHDNCEIIAKVDPNIDARIKRDDIRSAIIETVHRRPCTREDLLKILGSEKEMIDACINTLEKEGIISGKRQDRGIFYQTVKERP